MSNTQNVGLLLWLWLLVSGRLCTLSINRENPCIHLFFNSISRLWFELTWQLRILYTLEVIGGSTPFSFSFVTLINKTTLAILVFAARNATQTKSFTLILTQTYAMTQQITVCLGCRFAPSSAHSDSWSGQIKVHLCALTCTWNFMGPLKFRFSQWYKARPFTHNE